MCTSILDRHRRVRTIRTNLLTIAGARNSHISDKRAGRKNRSSRRLKLFDKLINAPPNPGNSLCSISLIMSLWKKRHAWKRYVGLASIYFRWFEFPVIALLIQWCISGDNKIWAIRANSSKTILSFPTKQLPQKAARTLFVGAQWVSTSSPSILGCGPTRRSLWIVTRFRLTASTAKKTKSCFPTTRWRTGTLPELASPTKRQFNSTAPPRW